MYLHLGQETVVKGEDVVGIFDMDNTTVSEKTRKFLAKAEKDGKIVYVSMEIPKSFIVMKDKTVFVSQISCATLLKRIEKGYSFVEEM